MKLMPEFMSDMCRRSHVLLSPRTVSGSRICRTEIADPSTYERLLTGMQRLRGQIYLEDGAVSEADLTPDGRHISHLDHDSWHFLTLEGGGQVVGCVRLLPHSESSSFERLSASHSALAQSSQWGKQLRECIRRERTFAALAGMTFLEAGGWALAKHLRHTTEAMNQALGLFAVGQLFDGAVAITTATMRNHSAPMLRRLGGRMLNYAGTEFPVYFDPQYGCEMAMIRFDSTSYLPKFNPIVSRLRQELRNGTVVTAARQPRRLPVLAFTNPELATMAAAV